MKLGILIDSVSVVPESELKRRGINVLPLGMSFEGKNHFDVTDQSKLIQIHQNGRIGIKSKSLSHTPSASDFVTYLLRNMVLDYDLIIYLATGPNFSLLHQNATEANLILNAKASTLRRSKGIVQPFRFINIDVVNAMTGVGLVAMLVDELHKSGSSLKDTLKKLIALKSSSKCLWSPKTAFMRGTELRQKANERPHLTTR